MAQEMLKCISNLNLPLGIISEISCHGRVACLKTFHVLFHSLVSKSVLLFFQSHMHHVLTRRNVS